MPLDPARDGFGFGNFVAADTDAVFDTAGLRAMFGAGVDVCLYGDATTCEPTAEAAAFARMVNLARSGGHCEGLVVRAAELFAQSPPVATSALDNSGEVTEGIIRSFATQLFGAVRAEAATWADRDLLDIVEELETSLSRGRPSHTMGLYTQSGGHSVLPYSVTWISRSVARVGVYDPNWPGMPRHVDVDVDADRWTFSFASPDAEADRAPWTGAAGTMDLVSLASREARRCPFCGEGGDEAVMLVRSAGSDWSVRTRQGVLTAGVATEVAGSVRPVRADAGAVRDHLVDLPASAVTGPDSAITVQIDSPARIVMLLPTAIVEVEVDTVVEPVVVMLGHDSLVTSGGSATVNVSRGVLGLAISGRSIALQHSPTEISATGILGNRRITERVDTVTKTNDESLSALTVDLPTSLVRVTDLPLVAPAPVVPTPVSTTTVPRTETAAPQPVRVTFDLSDWGLADDDPGSYGFVATDVVGGRTDETQECRSVACLRRKTVWMPRGGFDPTSGAVVLSPYEFRMEGSATPVEVRCGRRGSWVRSGSGPTGHSVSCRITNVTDDAIVHVRAR